jgi:hypothetical protein
VSISIGWTDGHPTSTASRPAMEQKVNVPFGSNMVLPGLEGGVLSVGATKDGKMCHLVAQHKRKHEDGVVGFFDDIQRFLDNHSIYRGKAFDGKGGFIDTAPDRAGEVRLHRAGVGGGGSVHLLGDA